MVNEKRKRSEESRQLREEGKGREKEEEEIKEGKRKEKGREEKREGRCSGKEDKMKGCIEKIIDEKGRIEGRDINKKSKEA